jgi:hypothetical protein
MLDHATELGGSRMPDNLADVLLMTSGPLGPDSRGTGPTLLELVLAQQGPMLKIADYTNLVPTLLEILVTRSRSLQLEKRIQIQAQSSLRAGQILSFIKDHGLSLEDLTGAKDNE